MTVARRLGIALALHLALLAGLLVHHVRTIDNAVTTAHDLTDTSARLVLAAARQSGRLAQLDETIAKWAVTRDRGYLTKYEQLRAEFAVELEQVNALDLSDGEREAMRMHERHWQAFRTAAAGIATWDRPGVPTGARLAALRAPLDALRESTETLADASQATMRARLAVSADAATRAEQLSWLAGAGALLLSVLTAALLMRSISEPLRRLAAGTREVARGRFGYRLDTRRGDEFAQVAAAFNSMTERLGALDRMKQEFVSTVSHDLKSPLASLRETNSLLLDEVPGSLSDAQRRVLVLQRESADRLGRMIAKLLDLSRLDAGLPLDTRRVEFGAFVEAAVEHARVTAREREVQVRLSASLATPLYVHVDEDRLRQLFDNLLENAIKFSPVRGVIDVAVREEADRIVLEVADRGPGVSEGERDRIFERFHQTAAGRAIPGRGVGLGLTICREIAQVHGGSIRVEPREGGGSVFIAQLPQDSAETDRSQEGRVGAGVAA